MKWVCGLLLVVVMTGCSGDRATLPTTTAGTDNVANFSVDDLLLSPAEIDSLMGTSMTALQPVSVMNDNRNLLPNVNCLGIWQVAEAAVYGERGEHNWQSMRQQMLREPDSDEWDSIVVQSVALYDSAQSATDFLAQSAARWSECTNHRVNITLNDKPLPRWRSGDLDQTDTRLSIPITRTSGDRIHSCEHVLAASINTIIDVQACKLQDRTVTQASDIATAIEAKIAGAASGK